ncbi:uncharacterized protein MYCFIDRAFT_26067 [Pseudocercospora fijiensis CIRAD86]|uniref:Uncharacterized protein n=1 Tax=Pseudocercospora fijiensis (strain CIRAD86) TaxID=383855 RepID=N1Q5Z2_PSEFD|nr:uncharacterized protein MYCFIDRAFT_26067 [Pseudocercospora fijiensis CIRAD86]EME87499.1 hypothetical protein MYCFIDRAFT_26067 [Pseudocercospora fijiensis CIRAD86]
MFFRRFLPFLTVACLSSFFLVSIIYDLSWNQGLQLIGIGSTEERIIIGSAKHDEEAKEFNTPDVNYSSPYPVGKTKPPGSNYTKALVIPKLKSEDTSWIEKELGDMLENGLLRPAVYTVNDRKAKLHPLKNKGHEVMVYLSYIIDFYDNLPDVSIFMHAHRFAWHNMQLLDGDAAKMVRFLSPEKVTRDGYMNLRCHTDPGCPDWLHPGNSKENPDKPEEIILAHSWSELFPIDPVPTVLAQPCCAQFAVSKDRILATNKMRYIFMRDWIIRTDLPDYLSGRVFEYVWQFIFTKSPIHCPNETVCHCDGYGLCFEDLEGYLEMKMIKHELEEDLRVWEEKKETAKVSVPEPGKDEVLRRQIARLERSMRGLWEEAFERGKDPRQRAKQVGRVWRDGDGY